MIKPDKTIVKETKYIGAVVALLSVLMQAVFLVVQKWDYKVLLGNLLSYAISVGNFYFMGLSVQKAVVMDEADARRIMKASHSMRTFGMFVAVAIGVLIPYFNTVAVILPVFFPRIAVSLRSVLKDKDKKEVIDK